MATGYNSKVQILAALWMEHRDEEEFQDFVEYNDLGLPLAYAISQELVESTSTAQELIDETFSMLLGNLGLEDTGYSDFDELLDNS